MSTPHSYFERMYAGRTDPWDFENRWYDARKHDLTVAALPRRRYRSAFEPGCSTGMLTARLAGRADRLLAVDVVPSAVATAAGRVTDQAHVSVRRAAVPHEWPDESFDLIVLSELGYYFDDEGLDVLLTNTVRTLEPGGDLVAVHWRHPVDEHARLGDQVHAALAGRCGLTRTVRHEEDDFLLEVYARTPPAARSVAEREGLA